MKLTFADHKQNIGVDDCFFDLDGLHEKLDELIRREFVEAFRFLFIDGDYEEGPCPNVMLSGDELSVGLPLNKNGFDELWFRASLTDLVAEEAGRSHATDLAVMRAQLTKCIHIIDKALAERSVE